MAIFTPLQGTGGMSDATINAMLQSGDPGLVKEANDYIAAREQEIKERGADKGILGAISNLFGFSKLAAAEPNQQKFSNQFSVTQPPQLEQQIGFKKAQLFDPTNMMRGSVVEDVVDTPTREFGTIRAGQPELGIGIKSAPAVQDIPVDFSEFDDLDSDAEDEEIQNLIAQAQQEERRSALDILRSFGKDVAGRAILSNILQGAGTVIGGPAVGAVAGITGLVQGGNIFEPSRSERAFNALTPQGRADVASIYGPGGIMEGYNPVSAFGRGPIGAIDARLDKLATRRAPQTDLSRQRARDLFAAREKIMSSTLEDDNRYTGPTSSIRGQKAGVMDDDPFADRTSKTTDSDAGGSSKIVCTMMNESYGFGNFRNKIWLRQSKDLAPEYQKGYHILFLPLVKMAKTNKTIKKVLEHIAVHRTIDIRQESRGKTHILGRLYRKVLEPICYWVGKYAKR